MLTQLTKEIEFEEKAEVLVSDRSVFDYYIYYVNKFGRLKAIEPLIKAHLKTYTCIIKVPIRQGFLKKDKIRSTKKEFQNEIDKKFDELLKLFNVEYINLKNKITSSNKEEIAEVITRISNGR